MGAGLYKKSKEEGGKLITKSAEVPTLLSQLLTGSWGCGVELPTVRLAHPITMPHPVLRPWCHLRGL